MHITPIGYEIVPKQIIEDKESMAAAIAHIHERIDHQKDLTIYEWQNDTNLSQRRLMEENCVTYFIRVENQLVGYATMRPAYDKEMPKPDSEGMYLSFIAIDPEKQRGKMGQALMHTMRQQAKILGSDYLVLDYHGTEKLKNFYQKFKPGTHVVGALQYRMNTETGLKELIHKMRVVYQLRGFPYDPRPNLQSCLQLDSE